MIKSAAILKLMSILDHNFSFVLYVTYQNDPFTGFVEPSFFLVIDLHFQ